MNATNIKIILGDDQSQINLRGRMTDHRPTHPADLTETGGVAGRGGYGSSIPVRSISCMNGLSSFSSDVANV